MTVHIQISNIAIIRFGNFFMRTTGEYFHSTINWSSEKPFTSPLKWNQLMDDCVWPDSQIKREKKCLQYDLWCFNSESGPVRVLFISLCIWHFNFLIGRFISYHFPHISMSVQMHNCNSVNSEQETANYNKIDWNWQGRMRFDNLIQLLAHLHIAYGFAYGYFFFFWSLVNFFIQIIKNKDHYCFSCMINK